MTFLRTTAGKLVVGALALAVATALDGPAYRYLYVKDIYDEDWGRLLRIFGYAPTWAIVGFALMQAPPPDLVRPWPRWRAFLPLIAASVSGIVAEIFKLLLRRERPSAHGGAYVFREWSERTFSTSGLALPSGHTIVAFGGAAMLARMYPRLAWLAYGLAAGCALTRVMSRGHFVSDVVLSAMLAWLVAALLWQRTKGGTQLRAHRGI